MAEYACYPTTFQNPKRARNLSIQMRVWIWLLRSPPRALLVLSKKVASQKLGSNTKALWQSCQLRKLSDKTQKLSNRTKQTRKWEVHRKALTDYRGSKEIKRPKRASQWRLPEETSSAPHNARLHRVLANANLHQPLQKKPDGTYSTFTKEILEHLMSGYFLGALCDLHICRTSTHPHRPCNEDWHRAANIIKSTQVARALSSF